MSNIEPTTGGNSNVISRSRISSAGSEVVHWVFDIRSRLECTVGKLSHALSGY